MKYIINSNNLDSYSRNIESGVETNGIKSNDFDSSNRFDSKEKYERVLELLNDYWVYPDAVYYDIMNDCIVVRLDDLYFINIYEDYRFEIQLIDKSNRYVLMDFFDSYLNFINALYDGDCDFNFVWED